MKKIWTPFVLVCSLLAGGEILSGGAVAQAAIKASGQVYANVVLDLGGGTTLLQSVAGLGFVDSAGAASKANRPTPTPVDVWFSLDPKSEAFTRAREYLSGKSAPFPASVQLADMNYGVKQVFNLGSAAIAELEFPGADASAKERPALRLRLQPESLSMAPGGGTVKQAGVNSKAAAVQSSNFRVSIDGAAAPEVIAVSPWIVRRAGSGLQISGLAVTVPLAQALTGTWLKWSEDALGGKPQADQKTLVLEYLDPGLKTTLMTFEFGRVSLTALSVPKLGSNAEQMAKATFQFSASELQVK